METRRDFLKVCAVAGVCAATPAWLRAATATPGGEAAEWAPAARIAARLRPPDFAARDFPIVRYGAVPDGRDCSAALRQAIAACHAAGGGRVLVPAGAFATGPVVLLSGVNLHLAAGATLRFIPDPRLYPLVFTRYEGVELMNYSPLIRAFGQRDIAITGAGTLDGGADCDHWWPWVGRRACGKRPAGLPSLAADRARLFQMAEAGVPVARRVFGPGHALRPVFIQPYRCRNVLVEGVTLRNSPMYHLHPVLCSNVIARRLTVASTGPNTDGCDPESCAGVLIEDCDFATGDDCIAIKSGRNADGRRLHAPARDIVVRRCRMRAGHGAVTIGSEISGGARRVFAADCRVGPAVGSALRLKNNAQRGGVVENVYARDFIARHLGQAGVTIDFLYEEGAAGPYTPVARQIVIRRMSVQGAQYALFLRGLPRAPVEEVGLADCDFAGVARPDVIANVRGLWLRDVRVNGRPIAEPPAGAAS